MVACDYLIMTTAITACNVTIVCVCVRVQCDVGDTDETELCHQLRHCQRFSTSAKSGEGISACGY